jgi:hypothetical protein
MKDLVDGGFERDVEVVLWLVCYHLCKFFIEHKARVYKKQNKNSHQVKLESMNFIRE